MVSGRLLSTADPWPRMPIRASAMRPLEGNYYGEGAVAVRPVGVSEAGMDAVAA